MRILATTNIGFIVEMDEQEIEKLTDTYYAKRRFSIGDTINIHKMYDIIAAMHRHESEVKEAVKALRRQADHLDSFPTLITGSVCRSIGGLSAPVEGGAE